MTRRTKLLTLAVIVVAGIAAYLIFAHRSGAGDAAKSPDSAQQVSALVSTQPLTRERVPDTLDVFGEVTTGQVIGINFPRAGQVTRLWVSEGRKVRRGAAVATLQSDPAARLAYIQAVNAANVTRRDLARTEELYKLQLATRSQVDNAHKAVEDAEANVQAQRNLGGDLEVATVSAPFDGVIVKLAVAQGDRVQPGATIAQIGHTDALRAQLGIEPDDSRRVQVDMPVTLTPVQDGTHSVQARIGEMHDLIDARTQLVNALVVLPDSATRFFVPGMKTRAVITLGAHDAWVVPPEAVLEDARGSYLFQVQAGRARRIAVKKGALHPGRQEITGSFDTRLPVVVLGNYELEDGMAVREKPPADAQPAQTSGTAR